MARTAWKTLGRALYPTLLARAKKTGSISAWMRLDKSGYEAASSRGMLLKIEMDAGFELRRGRGNVPGLRGKEGNALFEALLSRAAETSSKTQWLKEDRAAYEVAFAHDFLDRICEQQGLDWSVENARARPGKHQTDLWSALPADEARRRLIEAASSFSSKTAWKMGDGRSYSAARALGVVDDVAEACGIPLDLRVKERTDDTDAACVM